MLFCRKMHADNALFHRMQFGACRKIILSAYLKDKVSAPKMSAYSGLEEKRVGEYKVKLSSQIDYHLNSRIKINLKINLYIASLTIDLSF